MAVISGTVIEETTSPGQTCLDNLLPALRRLDALIERAVAAAQAAYGPEAEADHYRGLYISRGEVAQLLARMPGAPALCLGGNEPDKNWLDPNDNSRLAWLARTFNLSEFDLDAILIALAPEIDLRYERLYAYLQDDMTKKRPSVDLVLNLLSPSPASKLAARKHFTLSAPLIRHHLLHLLDDPEYRQPPLLSKYLKVDERIVNYLFNCDEVDDRLRPYVQLIAPQFRLQDLLLPAEFKLRLMSLVRPHQGGILLYFQGPYGVGKQSTAEALCYEQGIALLLVDGERLAGEDKNLYASAGLIVREALLQHAALYWSGFDVLLSEDRREGRQALLKALENRQRLTFLAGDAVWEPMDLLPALPFVRIEFPRPAYSERLALWTRTLNSSLPCNTDLDLSTLASKFRFSGGQICDAAATAHNLARWRDPGQGCVTMADLYAACRLQSNRKLATLAYKIMPHYTWSDIILPDDRLEQLREICNYVRYHTRVYDEWGFERKLSLGKGLNVLFAGPSGTGKTMAAEIMAGELGLDLYKIDLSTVVSKYIGETEKNLARIFAEAETSNAILFFDEADALFGKRSEIRDAHDRYANIEISYLLQKMEEYEGVTILATNLHKNMDDAFVRRMHFTVDFPFPTEADRRRIWDKIWPPETPQAEELNSAFMARQFELTGGNIRNVALAAAFLAADEGAADLCDSAEHGRGVTMRHLIHATRREYQKMGKVVAEEDFGEYAGKMWRKAS